MAMTKFQEFIAQAEPEPFELNQDQINFAIQKAGMKIRTAESPTTKLMRNPLWRRLLRGEEYSQVPVQITHKVIESNMGRIGYYPQSNSLNVTWNLRAVADNPIQMIFVSSAWIQGFRAEDPTPDKDIGIGKLLLDALEIFDLPIELPEPMITPASPEFLEIVGSRKLLCAIRSAPMFLSEYKELLAAHNEAESDRMIQLELLAKQRGMTSQK